MKRSFGKVINLGLLMALLFSGTALAQPQKQQLVIQSTQEESVLLPESVKFSVGREIETFRSKALASAMCTLTNKENGILGIYAETTMFQAVDWAGLTVYLDRWNEDGEIWNTVEIFEKEFTPADAEDGELTRAAVSIDVGTQPAGYYYRIRCIHELEYDNGWYEAKSTKTGGVLLTDIK